jgi:putative DNA primase/helicase
MVVSMEPTNDKIDANPPPELPLPNQLPDERTKYNLTDWGNARRLVDKYGDIIRYCPAVGWYIWDGTVWNEDKREEIFQYAKSIVHSMYGLIPQENDAIRQTKLLKFIQATENQRPLTSMIASARNEPGIPIERDVFDNHKNLINVMNGVLNLRTGRLISHNKELLLSKKIPCDYTSTALCPQWDAFLDQIVPNKDIQNFLQRYFGYALTGHTSEQVFVIAQGNGSNGKGTMIDTILDVISDYGKTCESETIIKKKYGRSASNDLADLQGARLVITSETEQNQVLDEGRIKKITGQDKIKCRFLYQEFFEYIPEFKLFLMTNHEPIIESQDYSIWRRVLKVPFNVKISREQADLHLRDKLISEREGIFRWLVDGALNWYDSGLQIPEVVLKSTNEYKEELDIIGDFLQMCTDRVKSTKVTATSLYKVYCIWCKACEYVPDSPKVFPRGLTERGIKGHKTNGVRYREDIQIKADLKRDLEASKDIENEKTRAGATGSTMNDFLRLSHGNNTSRDNLKKDIVDPQKSTDNDYKKVSRPQSRLSQEDVASIAKMIKLDWYPGKMPDNPQNLAVSFQSELIVRCDKRNFDLTRESAERYVKDAYLAWGWPTY